MRGGIRAGLFLIMAQALAAAGPASQARVTAAPSPPKLLVLIVAEQFRPDYLERHRYSLSPGGFNRLLKGGAVFRQCRYEYLATFPASGAAVLATGSYPERSGIVAEHWYDRRTRRVVDAVQDPEYALVGSDQTQGPAASPKNLLGTTLADQMRLATDGHSRTVSISLREATAALLGGRKPAGCYWLDEAGRFVTSSYYARALPAWVSEFQQNHPALRFRGNAWKALNAKETAPPLRVIDGQGANGLRDFFATYLASPLAVDEQFDFARTAVEAEQLGKNTSCDLLVMSVSSPYLLGLETGADSPLMRDMILRLDRKMEEFFSWLDARLGANNVWIVFTATQGLPESPEALEQDGIRGARVQGEQIATAVNARLSELFGPGNYVEKYVYPSLYLRRAALDSLPGRAAEAARAAGEAALAVPGVAGYFVPSGAASFLSPESASLFSRSLFPGRSGDVLIAYRPYHTEFYGDGRGISTGSFYSYDTRVPLFLYGSAFRAQTFDQPVSPTDLAPTLAVALDIAPPSSSTGRPLLEAFKER